MYFQNIFGGWQFTWEKNNTASNCLHSSCMRIINNRTEYKEATQAKINDMSLPILQKPNWQ